MNVLDQREKVSELFLGFLEGLRHPSTEEKLDHVILNHSPPFFCSSKSLNTLDAKQKEKAIASKELGSILTGRFLQERNLNSGYLLGKKKLLETMTQNLDALEATFIKTLRELRSKLTDFWFPDVKINEFFSSFVDGSLNELSSLETALKDLTPLLLHLTAKPEGDFKPKPQEPDLDFIETFVKKSIQMALATNHRLITFVENLERKMIGEMIRFKVVNGGRWNQKGLDSIQIKTSQQIYLTGFGLYRPCIQGKTILYEASVYIGNQLKNETKIAGYQIKVSSYEDLPEKKGNKFYHMHFLHIPLFLKAGSEFILACRSLGSEEVTTFKGKIKNDSFDSLGNAPFEFTKHGSSQNGTTPDAGQFPSIYFV